MKSVQSTFIVILLIFCQTALAWGPTGHRVVGYVAQQHLTKKASKKVNEILNLYSLEMCGNHMDFIKSDTNYKHMNSWHYVSIPDGMHYDESSKNPKGDVIATIEQIILELKTKEFNVFENEEFAIMALVHMVGDIHQPLHVGLAEDRGGNNVRVEWFGKRTNLHRMWDSELIDHLKLSYRELGDHINRDITPAQIKIWQKTSVRDWAKESQKLRAACYDFGDKKKLGYNYSFRHTKTIQLRLEQAGVRLAGLLNEIYG